MSAGTGTDPGSNLRHAPDHHIELDWQVVCLPYHLSKRPNHLDSLSLQSVDTAQNCPARSPYSQPGRSAFVGWSETQLRVARCGFTASGSALTGHHSLSGKTVNGSVVRTLPGVLKRNARTCGKRGAPIGRLTLTCRQLPPSRSFPQRTMVGISVAFGHCHDYPASGLGPPLDARSWRQRTLR